MVMWLVLAAFLISVRSLYFGILLSPTMCALLGLEKSDFLGSVTGNHVALEDPILLFAALLSFVFAFRHFRHARM